MIDLKAAAVGRRGVGGRAGQLLSRPMRDLMVDAEERLLQRTLRRSAEDAAAAAAPTPVAGTPNGYVWTLPWNIMNQSVSP